MGIAKIKEKNRDIIFWSGINADQENVVNSCDKCQKYQNQQKDENLITHESLISDNGPEYFGKDYKLFVKQWYFKHDSSCPYNPKSNGQIERTIQTIKKTLKISRKSNDDPYLAYLAPRTPLGPDNSTSPATLLYNRPIRRILPSMNTHVVITNKKVYIKKAIVMNIINALGTRLIIYPN